MRGAACLQHAARAARARVPLTSRSPSSIRSCITIETQKMISSMHGREMVLSMYNDDVELYFGCGGTGGGCDCCTGVSSFIASSSLRLCPSTGTSSLSLVVVRSRSCDTVMPSATKASVYFSCAER